MANDDASDRSEPLKVDLGANGGVVIFASLDEAARWLRTEIDAWQQAISPRSQPQFSGINSSLHQLEEIAGRIERVLQDPRSVDARRQGLLSDLERTLRTVFVDSSLPHSSTPAFAAIRLVGQRFGQEAARNFALCFAPPPSSQVLPPLSYEAWQGLILGILHRYPAESYSADKIGAIEASQAAVLAQLGSLHSERSAELTRLRAEHERANREAISDGAEAKRKFEESQTERTKAFDELLGKHEIALDAIRKSYREEMSLREPVKYWEEKKRSHKIWARVFGGVTLLAFVVAAAALGISVQSLLASAASTGAPESWRLGVLVIGVIFAIWLVRLLVRLFLSHVHLTADADERVVMARTYLSLLEGSQVTASEDRQLILQALFRPATDGIVRDDGAPPSFLEALTRSPRG